MSQEELKLQDVGPGIEITCQFNTVSLHLHTEEEAEKLYIALVEADRTNGFVKICFDKG